MLNFLKKFYHWSNTWVGTIVIVLVLVMFFVQSFIIPTGSMKRTLLIGDMLFVKKFDYGIPIPHLPFLEVPILPDMFGTGQLIEGSKPKREDIVVFRYPKNPKQHFVKRCFATPNDEILFQDKKMYIRMSEGDEYMKSNYPNKIHVINAKLWVLNPYMDKYKGINYDSKEDTFNIALAHLSKNDFVMQPVITNVGNAFYYKVKEKEYFMVGDNRDHSYDSRFWGAVPYKYIVGKPWFVWMSVNSSDFSIRWNRIGKGINTLQNNERYIDKTIDLGSGRT
ncbi:MAG: Signal peptidase I (EC [uncultured Campylobacterales bacterium]|uniref:Signal peptidase I n=1 Tax=uncultured Campylobacterales bacterium TaxID=352960 RepID=A0A6S6T201_9BACT|nr:MAG: Signal peptidase I (EC [uncultured Campylobacterales bacterium]